MGHVGWDRDRRTLTEPGAGLRTLVPRFRFFTFEPLGSSGAADGGTPQIQDVQTDNASGFADSFDPERPGMHISDSSDFVHVLSGEVVLELEQGETVAKKGDVAIMRGRWHRWINETAQACAVASVMVGTTGIRDEQADLSGAATTTPMIAALPRSVEPDRQGRRPIRTHVES